MSLFSFTGNKVLMCLIASFLFFKVSYSQQNIKIVDCLTNEPLENVLVFSGKGKFLGETTKEGICKITAPTPSLQIKGITIRDTLVELTENQTVICAKVVYYPIKEVVVTTDIDAKDYLCSLLENSKKSMLNLKSDSILYYKFKFEASVPDSNWYEILSGVVKIKTPGYNAKKTPEVFFCNVDYFINDEKFLNSRVSNYGTLWFRSYKFLFANEIMRQNNVCKVLKDGIITSFQNDSSIKTFNLIHNKSSNILQQYERKIYFDKRGLIHKYEWFNPIQKKTKFGIFVKGYIEVFEYSGSDNKTIDKIDCELICVQLGVLIIRKETFTKIEQSCIDCKNIPFDKSYTIHGIESRFR